MFNTGVDDQGAGAATARRMYDLFEPIHISIYFSRECNQKYRDLGMRGRHGYFASRSAPMGAVRPEVTLATFYVFAPELVNAALPAAWDVASPERILEARHAGADELMRQAADRLGDDAALAEAADLAREACAGLDPAGRPLFAGHAALPWPKEPRLALWHAATLLREHRGDGHVAALVHARLDPPEALVSYAAAGGPRDFLRGSRGWTDEEWDAAAARLRDRGLLNEGESATPDGLALRQAIEDVTDAAAVSPWDHLGETRTARLAELLPRVVRALSS
jgi:hypothetical protein